MAYNNRHANSQGVIILDEVPEMFSEEEALLAQGRAIVRIGAEFTGTAVPTTYLDIMPRAPALPTAAQDVSAQSPSVPTPAQTLIPRPQPQINVTAAVNRPLITAPTEVDGIVYTPIQLPNTFSDGRLSQGRSGWTLEAVPYNVLRNLAKMWREENDLENVDEMFDRLPVNYTVYKQQRVNGGSYHREIFGHRNGRFRSIKQFYVHFSHMMRLKTTDGCQCVNCLR